MVYNCYIYQHHYRTMISLLALYHIKIFEIKILLALNCELSLNKYMKKKKEKKGTKLLNFLQFYQRTQTNIVQVFLLVRKYYYLVLYNLTVVDTIKLYLQGLCYKNPTITSWELSFQRNTPFFLVV